MLRIHLKSNDVGLAAIRLTFFASSPKSLEWGDPKQLPDKHILGYAVIARVTQDLSIITLCWNLLCAHLPL